MRQFPYMKNSAPLCAFVLSAAVVFSIVATAQNATAPAKPKTATAAKKPAAKAGAAASAHKPVAPALTTPKDKASYALGYNLGRNLKGQMVDVDPAIVS